ncbi:hypothetical protein AAMO2058_000950500 [Amorphochlora amoebiformis]
MDVVALVSGGKDSCMSMLKCQQYGHRIVAIANLMPADEKKDEVDSYMYQTIGHNVVKAIAEAMEVPLVQRKITGKPLTKSLEYRSAVSGESTGSAHDEVEDMYLLLQDVKKKFPEVKAVCSGAILSNYQRNRVEDVCSRMGLVSLSYLWQKDQKLLLKEMIESGIDAIIVKTASMGLYPKRHLGKSLKELYEYLTGDFAKMGCHPCGEGGEYETLTVDCPLFSKRIQILESEIVGDTLTSIDPVAVLRISKIALTPKNTPKSEEIKKSEKKRQAGQTAPSQAEVKVKEEKKKQLVCKQDINTLVNHLKLKSIEIKKRVTVERRKDSIVFATGSGSQGDLVVAVKHAMSEIKKSLDTAGMAFGDIFYVHMYLADLGGFKTANGAYKTFFPGVNAPSRCCVETLLPKGASVMISAMATIVDRKVLHVQSISEWAPACIGPYSQATNMHGFLWNAGQIALDPPTLKMPESSNLTVEMVRCLNHCQSVLKVLNSGLEETLVCVVYWSRPCLPIGDEGVRQVFESERKRRHLPQHIQAVYIPVEKIPRNGLVEIQVYGRQRCKVAPTLHFDTPKRARIVQEIGSGWKMVMESVCLRGRFLSILQTVSFSPNLNPKPSQAPSLPSLSSSLLSLLSSSELSPSDLSSSLLLSHPFLTPEDQTSRGISIPRVIQALTPALAVEKAICLPKGGGMPAVGESVIILLLMFQRLGEGEERGGESESDEGDDYRSRRLREMKRRKMQAAAAVKKVIGPKEESDEDEDEESDSSNSGSDTRADKC